MRESLRSQRCDPLSTPTATGDWIAVPVEAYRRRAPHVLVVDDDESTRRMFAGALSLSSFQVVTARSGADAMRIANHSRFDCIIVDLHLGDLTGIDVMRALRDGRQRFILISGFLSIETAVEAMKLGAVDVLEKPVDPERLVAMVSALLDTGAVAVPTIMSSIAQPPAITSARCATERWVGYVLRACEADGDLKTLASWAQTAAVSYTTLCANCRIMQIRPLDARDFMRVLRAVKRAAAQRCPPAVLLDVSDARTIRTLSLRSGVDLDAEAGRAAIPEFLARQQFVPGDHLALQVLREVVSRW